ncbi:MAG: ABC transporter permease [Alphaproteobacteria bacterium]|nr:ABC transporter permease [Alphaproteobacteria bacterium]
MGRYFLHRMSLMAPTLIAISALIFLVIQLPPGDYLSNQVAELRAQGEEANLDKIAFMRSEFGFDRPLIERYGVWIGVWPGANGFSGFLQGNWGWSFEYNKPVREVLGDSLALTVLLNFATVLVIYLIAFPIGILSAAWQYSLADYGFTFLGYIGLATPNFLLSLILLYYANLWFGLSIGGLMAPEYIDAAWSWGKARSVLEHLVIPVLVIGGGGAAAMIRRLRANLLDELQKPYVTTALAKGLTPFRVLLKYPLRMALNPFIADIGDLLPQMVSGSVIVSVVLNLPTIGPVLLQALRSQDHYLAGFILLFAALLTVIGMAVSDLLLALLDPRIRLSGRPAA